MNVDYENKGGDKDDEDDEDDEEAELSEKALKRERNGSETGSEEVDEELLEYKVDATEEKLGSVVAGPSL